LWKVQHPIVRKNLILALSMRFMRFDLEKMILFGSQAYACSIERANNEGRHALCVSLCNCGRRVAA